VNIATVRTKLALIAKYLKALDRHSKVSKQAYLDDEDTRFAVERIIELIVECATDINSELLLGARQDTQPTYYDSFLALGESGVVPHHLAKKLASTAGLRNRLAHEYEEVKNDVVFWNIGNFRNIYPQYLKHVAEWLDKQANEEEKSEGV
jgi:uncharacterized protein YutE (UPF0331/DUF86 family)